MRVGPVWHHVHLPPIHLGEVDQLVGLVRRVDEERVGVLVRRFQLAIFPSPM